MTQLFKTTATMLLLLFAAHAWTAQQNPQLVMVTGEHWTPSTLQQKNAYLFGIGNMIQVERAMHGDSPHDAIRQNSSVPVLVDGLSEVSLQQVREFVDVWFANNPDRLDRPVIEVIYMEIALPNSQSASK